MKAASVQGKGRFEIEEIPKPEAGPGELLLKVLYCSICGADVERVFIPLWDMEDDWYRNQTKGTILGHEYVGLVEAVGEGVTGWSVGDRSFTVLLKPDYSRNEEIKPVHGKQESENVYRLPDI